MTADEISQTIYQLEANLLERVQLREQLAAKLLKQRNALLEASKALLVKLDSIWDFGDSPTPSETLDLLAEEIIKLRNAITQVDGDD